MTKKSGNGASVSARDINSNEGGADKHDSVLHKLGVPAGLGTMRALEPRILLDAAALATFSDAASDQAALEASQWQREQQPDLPHTGEGFSALPTPVQVEQSPPLPLIDENSLNDDFSLTDGPTTSGSNQIVFIDSAIEDLQSIVESIGDGIEIVIIDANSDGVEQIASVLESRENIDAIHIFSHGRSGTLDLGSTKLTEASIASRHADEMETIRAALSENADILLYGCDFGANARGVSAIEALAEATGADIAASEDLTGAANLGGDWDLEIEAGSVETDVIAAAVFAGVLIDSDGDFIDDLVDDDDDNDGILDVDEGFGTTVVGGGKHIVLVVDESGSIDPTEQIQIRIGLTAFIDSQIGSGNTISIVGMSAIDTNTRADHVLNIFMPTDGTDNTAPMDAWIALYGAGTRPGIFGLEDNWGSGLEVAATLGLGANDEVIVIADGAGGSAAIAAGHGSTLVRR